MTSQGWQPGQYLGAKDASHAEFHTAANASHIRIAIKDDNLGLGAKIGTCVGHGECTGLDAFKNILGRLNGKDEDELAAEKKSREDLKRAIYTERRWGSIRFVKGGFLVGDKIQYLIDGEAERLRKLAEGDQKSSGSDFIGSGSEEEKEEDSATVVETPKKSKRKRKLEDVEETVPEVVAIKVKKSKKKRKTDSSRDEDEVAAALEVVKLSKKKSKKDREPEVDADDTGEDVAAKKRKREKRDRKERKERKDRSKSRTEEESAKESKKKAKRDKANSYLDETPGSSKPTSLITTKESTPLAAESSGRSTPIMQGRHAVRSRNIAQKRLASMDVAALNQVSYPSFPQPYNH